MPVAHFKVTPFLCFEKLGVWRLQTTAPDPAEQPHHRAKKRFLDLRHLDSEEWTMWTTPIFWWKWYTHTHMSLTYVLPSYRKSEYFFWIGETRPWRNIILSNSFHFYLFDLPFLFGLSSAKNPADPRDPGRNKPELHTVLWNDFWLLNVSIDSVINWWVDHVPKKTGEGSMKSLLVGWSSLL